MNRGPRYLLLQVRDKGDPVIRQEVCCFAEALGCGTDRVTTHDLLGGCPSRPLLDRHDLVLLGGSGDYSAAGPIDDGQNAWLARALDALRQLHSLGKPTFASCWGFQALCRAMGGECVHDSANAELGSVELELTDAGRDDPIFGRLPKVFLGFEGHQDRVTRLPEEAVLLASSHRVAEQALRFRGRPIYATQFHPELTRETLIERLRSYPEYVERIAGVPLHVFTAGLPEASDSHGLLRRFADTLLDNQ